MPNNFKNNRSLPACILTGLLVFMLAMLGRVNSSLGQEAEITDFTVSNSESSLLVYLDVANWLTDDMEAAIHNGIPITFSFNVDVLEERNNWPDKKIREYEFTHVLEYDSLKKEYHIHRDEKDDTRVTGSVTEAASLMSEINGFRVLPLDELSPGITYIIKAKAKLARRTMPLYFHYLMPFSSPWDFETDWRELTLHLKK